MNEILIGIFSLITIIAAISAGFSKDPYAKLIAIGLLAGGVMPLIVDRGYLDVAAAVAVLLPLSTIFILQLCRKGET